MRCSGARGQKARVPPSHTGGPQQTSSSGPIAETTPRPQVHLRTADPSLSWERASSPLQRPGLLVLVKDKEVDNDTFSYGWHIVTPGSADLCQAPSCVHLSQGLRSASEPSVTPESLECHRHVTAGSFPLLPLQTKRREIEALAHVSVPGDMSPTETVRLHCPKQPSTISMSASVWLLAP